MWPPQYGILQFDGAQLITGRVYYNLRGLTLLLGGSITIWGGLPYYWEGLLQFEGSHRLDRSWIWLVSSHCPLVLYLADPPLFLYYCTNIKKTIINANVIHQNEFENVLQSKNSISFLITIRCIVYYESFLIQIYLSLVMQIICIFIFIKWTAKSYCMTNAIIHTFWVLKIYSGHELYDSWNFLPSISLADLEIWMRLVWN